MSGSKLESDKDIGIIVSDDLKWEKHCSAAVSKANRKNTLYDKMKFYW